MRTKLSVNLNKVALLRNQRDVGYPSVVGMARLIIAAGANGITVHPRPDERHIRVSDVYELSRFVREECDTSIEFNIEGNPTKDFMALVRDVLPHQVTLVPDAPEQRTSDHGWDTRTEAHLLEPIIAELKGSRLRVSLFVDPNPDAVAGAHAVGADRIELYTEPYAAAFAKGPYEEVLAKYAECAELAVSLGLRVNAGHDLTIENTRVFKRAVPNLAEVSIGHAITADALEMGFPRAVEHYLAALEDRDSAPASPG